MKRAFALLILMLGLLTGCDLHSQQKNDGEKKIAPKTDIKVTKEYDEHGNLIRYDSVYTWYYSLKDSGFYSIDSLMNDFRSQFNRVYPFSMQPFFRDNFFPELNDTLFFHDFFRDDYFYQRFRKNMRTMDDLFREMDSVKNRFFDDFYRQQRKTFQ